MHSSRQAVWIVLLAALIGHIVNEIRSDGIELFVDRSPEARLQGEWGEIRVIGVEEAGRLHSSKKAVFIDARSPEDYHQGHILNAHNLPWESFDQHVDGIIAGTPMEETIVVYCDGEECSLSEHVAKELFFRGYDHVRVLLNGWSRWLEAGLPIEKG